MFSLLMFLSIRDIPITVKKHTRKKPEVACYVPISLPCASPSDVKSEPLSVLRKMLHLMARQTINSTVCE